MKITDVMLLTALFVFSGMILSYGEVDLSGYTDLTSPDNGIITYCASHDSYPGTMAFDNGSVKDDKSRWLPHHSEMKKTTGAWVQFEFNEGDQLVNAYRVWGLTSHSYASRNPKDFKFEGSNDGEDWVLLDSQTDQTGWTDAEPRAFAFPNSTPFKYFKFTITDNNGASDYTGVSELEFFYLHSESDPVIDNMDVSNLTLTSATLNGNLVSTGLTETAVIVYWGTTDGGWDSDAWDDFYEWAAPQEPGQFSLQLNNLAMAETYYYRFAAVNSAGEVMAPNSYAFTTLGAPVLGPLEVVVYEDSFRCSVPLLSIGAAPVDVTCWIGTEPDQLTYQAAAWTSLLEADVLTCTVEELLPGDTWYVAFECSNVMPDNPLNTVTVWSETEKVIVGARTVIWDAKTSSVWDTTSANWHLQGDASGTTTFTQGNSAVFDTTSKQNISLDTGIVAANLTIANGSDTTWVLGGTGALTINESATITDLSNSSANAIDIRLRGAGELVLDSGRFSLGNKANDFTGGLKVKSGRLDVAAAGDGAAFGAGAVILGESLFLVDDTANLDIASEGQAYAYSPQLKISSGINSSRLTLSGGDIDLQFDGFIRDDSATLSIVAPTLGSTQLLSVDGIDTFAVGGVLPPWLVYAEGTGTYIETGMNGLIPMTTPVESVLDISGSDVLTTSMSVSAARITSGNLNLGGNVITTGGAILGNNTSITGEGAVNLINPYTYFYTSGNASINSSLAGPAEFVKFGIGKITINSPDTRKYRIQEGTLAFNPAIPFTLSDSVTGAGTLEVGVGAQLSSTGTNAIGSIYLPDNAMLVFDGSETVAGRTEMRKTSTLVLTNGATHFNVSKTFIVGSGNVDGSTLVVSGQDTLLDLNGFSLALGHNTRAHGNRVFVSDGGVITNAAMVGHVGGEHGYDNHAFISGGAAVYAEALEVGWKSTNCTVTISDEGTIWDNGGGAITLGFSDGSPVPRGNALYITDGALLRNVGSISVPRRGANGSASNNRLELRSGSRIESKGDIRVGYPSSSNSSANENYINVSDPGTVWDAGNGILWVGYSAQGISIGNNFVVENGAEITNVGQVRVGAYNARDAMENCLIITNNARISSRDSVRIGYPVNDKRRGVGTGNSAYIAGGPLGDSTWDMNNTSLFIGNNRGDTGYSSCTNSFIVAGGGIVNNINEINVGQTPIESSHENSLVLAGGEMYGATMFVQASNRVDVVISEEGINPVVLSDRAVFEEGSVIAPMLVDSSLIGHWIPIVQVSENGSAIVDNGLTLRVDENDHNRWLVNLSDDGKTLYLSARSPATLMLIH